MNSEDVLVPATGNDGELEVIEISVSVGDGIEVDDTIVVLESDKATVEVPSPKAGKVLEIAISVGDKVKEGDALLKLSSDSEKESGEKESSKNTKGSDSESDSSGDLITELDVNSAVLEPSNNSAQAQSAARKGDNAFVPLDVKQEKIRSSKAGDSGILVTNANVHAGPAVRKFSREHGVDLGRVKPSGPKERILVEDVSAYIKSQVQQVQSGAISSSSAILASIALPDFSKYGEISVSSMSNVHYKTAENMQRSWSVPQVTQFDEVDITDMEAFRKSQKSVAESRGLKLTPIAFILKACAYVLKTLPQFNVSLDLAQKQLIQKHFIHIGFAVDTPHGLFVPVIKDVDKKSIWGLAAECQDLASRAKEKKLSPAEMQGGCFTVSSLGAIGGTNFTPIVNSPEVAILGVSKAQMKPAYVNGNNFEARLMLPLSLSYDHRAVNGADGARFTSLLLKVMGDLRELLL